MKYPSKSRTALSEIKKRFVKKKNTHYFIDIVGNLKSKKK